MSTENGDDEDRDLMARYLAGMADADAVARLESRLTADPSLRRTFLSHANVDAALAASVRPAPAILTKPKNSGVTRRWMPVLAAAAAVVISAGWLWQARSGVEVRILEPPSLIADATLLDRTTAAGWAVGSVKRLREIELGEGSLRVGLPSGVVLDLVAPVKVHLIDAMRVRVAAGAVTADAGPAGAGFTLDTPDTQVVDLGTRFGVNVLGGGETDVAVFDGKVELRESGRAPAVLDAGDSVRVGGLARIRRQALISTRGESAFILEPAPSDALVTGIEDNIAESGFHSFYTIQRGAMRPGVRPYSTLGKPRWQAAEGGTFPEELLGADVIGTFSADRHEPSLELTLTVSRPCAVYVMLDARGEVPDWVRQDFSDTGWRLRGGPWADNPVVRGMTADEKGEIHLDYAVWKKEVDAAGPVVLGPPFPEGNATRRAMYGVAVK